MKGSSATTRDRPQLDDARCLDRGRDERRDTAAGDVPRLGRRGPDMVPGSQPDDCANINPFGIDPTTYAELYQGSVGTVGQAETHFRRGAPSIREGTRSSGRTPSHPPRRAMRTGASGDACTAASPMLLRTNCGSRQSDRSRRTTPSSRRPTMARVPRRRDRSSEGRRRVGVARTKSLYRPQHQRGAQIVHVGTGTHPEEL